MKAIINKQQLSIVPKWTNNIKDEWINPIIFETCEVRFRDTISKTLYDAMAASVGVILDGTQGNDWDITVTYNAGAIVKYQGLYYVALNTVTGGNAPDTNADWQVYELINFWSEFVVPYLCYEAYKSYLIWAGKHIAMGGVRRHLDNTSTEVSGEDLGVLLGDLKYTVGVKYTKMNNELNAKNYTFDGVQYAANIVKPRNRTGIYAV